MEAIGRWNTTFVSWILSGLALVTTIGLAVVGSSKHPPSSTTAAVFVLVVAALQLGAVRVESQGREQSKIQQTRNSMVLGRLVRLAEKTALVRVAAEREYAAPSDHPVQVIGRLSVDLSWIEEGIVTAMDENMGSPALAAGEPESKHKGENDG